MSDRIDRRLRSLTIGEDDRHAPLSIKAKIRYGLPLDAEAFFSSITAAVAGERWADYRIENVGFVAPTPTVEHVPWLEWWVPVDDDPEHDLYVITWRRWVRYKGSHACVLAEWVPQEFRTEIAVRNIDRIPGIGSADAQKAREADAEAEAVWRGRGLLWFENRGGRRRLEDMPEDDPASYWREFADQAIDMMARDRIALHHAAARLKIELGTLKRWVNRRRRERKNPQPVHENDPK